MRVAIYGSYNHGNYGDDLMAIIFGQYVKKLGHEVVIFRFALDLANRYGFESCDKIESLIRDSDLCVIGGGAFLVGRKSPSDKIWNDIEKTSRELGEICESLNCSIIAVSIGGDNKPEIGPGRAFLFSRSVFKEASVRLLSNQVLLKKLGKKGIYHPDILFHTSAIWKAHPKRRSEKFAIGINLVKSRYNNRFSRLLIKLVEVLNFPLDITFFQLHRPQYDYTYEISYTGNHNRIRNSRYIDPDSFINVLSNQDLVISSKLHLGITALSYGINFLSLGGELKTTELLKSIGLKDLVLTNVRTFFLVVKLLISPASLSINANHKNIVKNEKARSKNHLIFLSEWLAKTIE